MGIRQRHGKNKKTSRHEVQAALRIEETRKKAAKARGKGGRAGR